MKARDIIAAIEEFAPLSIQEEWDNSGLQTGSPEQEVHGVLVGFDCTEALIEEAVRRGCDFVLTHHPLLFNPLRSICPENPTGAAVIAAVRNGIAVYAAHTTADKVPGGVSGLMARRLSLQDIRILEEEAPGVGLGAVGNLPEALSAAEATALVKERFGLPFLRTSRPVDCPVRTVAMCGGSGSSCIDSAIRAGAQLFLCGDISYHHFFVPDGFMVADVGHFESEVEIVDVFHSILKKKFPNFASLISKDIKDSNPVYYS